MTHTCRSCTTSFTVDPAQKILMEKVAPVINGVTYALSDPTHCPTCRTKRRLQFRNERNLYRRPSSVSGNPLISIYSEAAPFPVLERAYWWGDDFDGKTFGKIYDTKRTVIEQFTELYQIVPRMALLNEKSENSEYTNVVSNNKDCYMIFSSDYNQNGVYGDWLLRTKDTLDSSHITDSELCYGCVDGERLYKCISCVQCSEVKNSAFCFQCRNVSDSLFCTNLRNAQYCIFNVQYTKEEYETKRVEINLSSYKVFSWAYARFLELMKTATVPGTIVNGICEAVEGNYIRSSKRVKDSFDVIESQDVTHSADIFEARDICDGNYVGFGELSYEALECVPVPTGSIGVMNCYGGANVYYSVECMNSRNLFACVGLKRAEYCILNTQYTKEEYEALVPVLIASMKAEGWWGEFFPVALSPFAYNETNAQDIFPLTPEEAKEKGIRWKEEVEKNIQEAAPLLPDSSKEATEALTTQIFSSVETRASYRIIPQELALILKMGVPLPHKGYKEREEMRRLLRLPREMREMSCTCAKEEHVHHTGTFCGSSFFSSQRQEAVCRPCYEQSLV